MNRTDLQKLSSIRSLEAQSLFASGFFSGSYYLAGYAVECALKACIAKLTAQDDFPDKDRVTKSYTHNLHTLLVIAKLDKNLEADSINDPNLGLNWITALRWNESKRYEIISRSDAQEMMQSLVGHGGLVSWIVQYW
jgi:HEPN domain-containing protein